MPGGSRRKTWEWKELFKKFSKKKKNLDTMMFEIVDVKNPNARSFIKYYINDTTTISNSVLKFSCEFENFVKKQARRRQMRKRKSRRKKRIRKKTRTRTSRRRRCRRQINEVSFFIWRLYKHILETRTEYWM